ncbi:MAG: DUF421 domain-containing protein [Clostridia bacterium]|nr:DUF421 domain-containing protein [Clostridia bacterium]
MITVILRTAIIFIFVTLAIRIMGKRQIGDMQPNELVITILLSEIAAIPLQDTTQPLLNGIIAILVLVVLEVLISVLALKSNWVRKIMNGQSVVIIKNGVIDQSAMKKVRMTVLDLIEQLRIQNVFDISTVAFAVLEVNGELSVLLKSKHQPATVTYLDKKKTETAILPLPVITDGKLIQESIQALEITAVEVEKILKNNNTKLNNVFLLTLDRKQNMTLIKMR